MKRQGIPGDCERKGREIPGDCEMKGPRSHGDCEYLAAETHGEEEEGILGCRDRERRVKNSGCRKCERKAKGLLPAETESDEGSGISGCRDRGRNSQTISGCRERERISQAIPEEQSGILAAGTERGTVRQFLPAETERDEGSGNSWLKRQREE